MTSPRVVVRMRDVTIGYGDEPVVRHADLTVTDGEVVAVLGANGSGKTTLVRGMLGLADVLSGDVELCGRRLRGRRDRARVGYVPQRHTVGGAVPSTVREVVSSGRLARLGPLGRLRAADRACVQTAIDTVQLGPFADVDVAQLSGGQQRRVLIARALAAEPEVLVMDEPTAGVDRASQQALADTIRRLAERGVPMLVVTHEAGPLADVFTRAVVVSDGRIVADGPIAGLPADLDVDGHHHDDEPEEPARPGGASWLEQPMGGA
ncbi:MAG: metal ABC transporter ATP-binding protein [Angustibacter sp.]